MNKVSMSHEDYLEAIVMLGGNVETPVRSIDIANKLNVSKASVSKAIAALKDNGYVVQPYYGDISLTQEGLEYGKSVLERHKLLTDFLSKAVGIDAETAEEEACLMEHAISDASFKKWVEYIKGLEL